MLTKALQISSLDTMSPFLVRFMLSPMNMKMITQSFHAIRVDIIKTVSRSNRLKWNLLHQRSQAAESHGYHRTDSSSQLNTFHSRSERVDP
jgi:hypothetical protein